MRGNPQYREERVAWLHQEAPGSLPSRLYLHYSVFQVALIFSKRHIKELLWTIHSMTLISKQIDEPSKPTKQTPNSVLPPDTACDHASTAASVATQSQTLPHWFSSPSILSSPRRSSHTNFWVLWSTCRLLIKYWLGADYISAVWGFF